MGSIASDVTNEKVVNQVLFAQNMNNEKEKFLINGKDESVVNYGMKAKETYENIKVAITNTHQNIPTQNTPTPAPTPKL